MRHLKLIACLTVTLANAAGLSLAAGGSDTNSAFPELKKQQEQLTLENNIADQQLHKELAALMAEKQRLELENSVTQQKHQAELAALQAELDNLIKQTDLMAKRAAAKEMERKTQLDEELAADREKLERMRLTNELATVELAEKNRELGQREQELRVRIAEMQAARSEYEMKLAKLNTDLDLRVKQDFWKNRVTNDIQYTMEPFKDGVLTISDRRIPLNGPIWQDMADYIAERIDYFNNQNREYPIFIVIDTSPGGSVMAGYKILKAMEGSAAPVYVVVKSFAASMAANIATQAKKSYAYPNAIILHHQVSGGVIGNMTMQKEQVKDTEEWWKRLAEPVAAKMGISLDEFIKRMYAHRSTGDWIEFGDVACQDKWVDQIVSTIHEESYDKNPDQPSAPGESPRRGENGPRLPEQVDAAGHHYVLLPRLEPVDCYYLYNPDDYYRLTP